MAPDDPNRLRRYCLCGASLLGRAAPADLAAALLTAWDGLHGGPGHGAATASQARNARRRADRVAVDVAAPMPDGSVVNWPAEDVRAAVDPEEKP